MVTNEMRDKLEVLIWNYLNKHTITYDQYGPDPTDVGELTNFIVSQWAKKLESKP